MASTMKEFLDNALNEKVAMSTPPPKIYQGLKNIQKEFLEIRKQMRKDGHEKQADIIFLEWVDLSDKINGIYRKWK